VKNAQIRYSVRQGTRHIEASIRKPGERWRGNPQRPERHVYFYDLSRMQPVAARIGYTRLVKSHHEEISSTTFDKYRLQRFSQIMGRAYDIAKMAITNIHRERPVPVLSQQGTAVAHDRKVHPQNRTWTIKSFTRNDGLCCGWSELRRGGLAAGRSSGSSQTDRC
jgi:hypothetical protein